VRGRDRPRAAPAGLRASPSRRGAAPHRDRRPDRRARLRVDTQPRGTLTEAAEIAVRLQPRARRTEVAGRRGGAVVIRVTAPPVDGKANAALCAFVAQRAGVAPSRVQVVRGATGRDKVVRVEGIAPAALSAALGA
jgi:uncharacterized protein